MERLHIPGMTVLVVDRDGVVRCDLLGVRDAERKLPLDADTRIYIASCTKVFTAYAVALLAHEGKIDLDAPVRRYLPDFTLADAAYADSVTVRDLLGHRPGLANPAITFGDAYTGQMTEERYYRLLAKTNPERSFMYSNLHYTLLGRVIEAVAGKSWKDVLTERIFGPAGMTRTTCDASVFWSDDNIAIPYDFENGRFVVAEPRKSDATMHAAGGIYSTSHDLARWLRLQIGDGVIDGKRVIPAAALRTMRDLLVPEAAEPHPLVATERRISWGAGWDIRVMREDTLYCHNGTYSGSGAFISCMPARELGVAVIANGGGIAVFLAELIAAEAYDAAMGSTGEDYLPTLFKIADARARRNAAAKPHGALSRPVNDYAGQFHNDDWGTMDVVVAGDSLDARVGAFPMPVQLTGTDRFTSNGYTCRFDIDAAGIVRGLWFDTSDPDSSYFDRR